MATLKLAANLIEPIAPTGYGHLQIVYENGSSLEELEVQAPWNAVFLGKWQYPDRRDHTDPDNTSNYGVVGEYKSVELDLGDRLVEDVWTLLKEIHLQFQERGNDIDYDVYQNSNSYATVLLDIIGLNVFDYFLAVRPDFVSSFPGIGFDILAGKDTAIDLDLSGSAQGDIINTGMGFDRMAGGGGSDTLSTGDRDDFLIGGSLSNDPDLDPQVLIKEFDPSAVDLRVNHTAWNDNVSDTLAGGFGDDSYYISHYDDSAFFGNYSDALTKIDIVDEREGDGVGYLYLQNYWSYEVDGVVVDERTTAIETSGNYEVDQYYDGADGTMYTNVSWSTDQSETDWKAAILVSNVLDEDGNPYIFLNPIYPDNGLPYVAIKGFRQGDFGISLENYSSPKEGTSGNDTLQSGAGSSFLVTPQNSDLVLSSDPQSDQRLHAGAGDDVIYGRGGQDEIRGDEGDDLLFGNEGDDRLTGGIGNDVYAYSRGDGEDTIIEAAEYAGTNDRITFTDINADDVLLLQEGNDLRIVIRKSAVGIADAGSILVEDMIDGYRDRGIESITFADDTTLSRSDIINSIGLPPAAAITGTASADTLVGTDESDVISALTGNDTIFGHAGDDVISGGDDDDIITVGPGFDEIDGGNGSDTVNFDGSKADFTVTAYDANTIRVHSAGASALVDNVEWIVFRAPDGNEQTINAIDFLLGETSPPITGTSGDDTLIGGSGNDTIQGGDGSDRIDGGYGSDVAVFEYDLSAYAISVVDGQVRLVNGDFTDTVTDVELLQFNDMSVAVGASSSLTYFGTTDDDTITGTTGGDTIKGSDGNDTVDGLPGNDHLHGGKGADFLNGGEGADSYTYSLGDGSDYIDDEAASTTDIDVLRFADINLKDLSFARSGVHLQVTVAGTGDTITLDEQYYHAAQGWGLEKIEFADGTSLELDHSTDTTWINGTAAAETIEGTWGKDIIRAGQGDDQTNGSAGGDTYIYFSGDGSDYIDDEAGFTDNIDVLRFGDLNRSDLTFARDGANLKITLSGTGEVITVDEQFYSTEENWGMERIEFADGTSWDLDDIWTETPAAGASPEGSDSAAESAAIASVMSERTVTSASESPATADIISFPDQTGDRRSGNDDFLFSASANAADDQASGSGADIIPLQNFLPHSQGDDPTSDLWFEPEPIGAVI
ncbi:hypothetical protein HFO28_25315 [Rhizobium leguminosarum]|uniref:calcium-binding protein n=1 Tax=Rhizobium leguminosarum TaxID=384 RepID=UPI001C942C7D|nr:calcium-binding protein [Rhizobium leguminosarum]MBY5746874.1 hypothetical protein [Rhizobium leguminosarum]